MHHRALSDEEVYRICVGDDDSTRYYLDRFEHFDLGGGPGTNIDAEYLPSECRARSP